MRRSLVLLALAACGDEQPKTLPDAAPDAPLAPPITLQVSKDGNDAHDGVTAPVETLKHAIELATANSRVTDIVLAAGMYTIRDGETFGYTVPSGVEITGPVAGGAVLVGTGAETGLVFSTGQLQDIELQNFKIAVEADIDVRLKNLRVTNSATAIHAGTGSKLRINELTITGPSVSVNGLCPFGFSLDPASELTVTGLTTTNIGPVIEAADAGTVDIANAKLTTPSFACQHPTLEVLTTKGFAMADSTVDGGASGLNLVGRDPAGLVTAKLTNTTFSHSFAGIEATGVVLQLDGVIVTSNDNGITLRDGSYSITSSSISATSASGIVLRGSSATRRATLTMRHTLVLDNSGGVVVEDFATADLGTTASPGANTLQQNLVQLDIQGPMGATQISAVGNTWTPNVQGADAAGRYPTTETIPGPVTAPTGGNFAIADGWSVLR